MGGETDGRVDGAGQRLGGERAGTGPADPFRPALQRAVAGEGELAAAAGAQRPLIDDATHAVRPGGVAGPVQHHLRNGTLTVLAFGARLVIDRLREAIERAQAVQAGTTFEGEGGSGRSGRTGEERGRHGWRCRQGRARRQCG